MGDGVHGGMTSGPEPILLPNGDGHLFAVRHRCAMPVQARVLMCPPLLQEHARSYRFFAQLAEQWARHGIEVIRFDYTGSGDSSGTTQDLDAGQAIDDIRHAWDRLVPRGNGIPRILCGVRMGALLAAHAIDRGLDADMAWWWQPVSSGAAWIETLEAIDVGERRSRSRFPLQPGPRALAGELMGHALDPDCVEHMRRLHWPSLSLPSIWLLGSEDALEPRMRTDDIMRLPLAFDAWPTQIDFETIIPIRLADATNERLFARARELAA